MFNYKVIILKEKAMELLNIFYENGYEAYVVGGFVRNMILGLPSFDVDFIHTKGIHSKISSF